MMIEFDKKLSLTRNIEDKSSISAITSKKARNK